jgi:hypothetical protein
MKAHCFPEVKDWVEAPRYRIWFGNLAKMFPIVAVLTKIARLSLLTILLWDDNHSIERQLTSHKALAIHNFAMAMSSTQFCISNPI